MKSLNKPLLFIATFSLLLFSCHSNKNASTQNFQVDTVHFSNITILLDLSNRIDSKLHPDQIQRDTLIIADILKNFDEQVRRNGFIYSRDKIQVLIAPQAGNKPPTFNPNIDVADIEKTGKIVRQVLPESERLFLKEVNDIYANKQVFNGADIYTFFKDFQADNFIQKSYEEKSAEGNVYFMIHNKMIILTDGYLNFESKIQAIRSQDNSCMQMDVLRHDNNWQQNFSKFKLKPVEGKEFQNLEVMLLEVNPLHPEINVRESEIIEKYWRQWFEEMKIDYKPMHQANEGIPLINSAVKSFLTNE